MIGNFSETKKPIQSKPNPIIFIRFSDNRQLTKKWKDFSVKISRKLKILVANRLLTIRNQNCVAIHNAIGNWFYLKQKLFSILKKG